MKNETMESNLKKLKFWDIDLIILISSFSLLIIFLFVFSAEQLEGGIINGWWLIILFIFRLTGLVFTLGMIYYSSNQRKYIWLILIILSGIILPYLLGIVISIVLPIVFYFYYVRPQFKKAKGREN